MKNIGIIAAINAAMSSLVGAKAKEPDKPHPTAATVIKKVVRNARPAGPGRNQRKRRKLGRQNPNVNWRMK